MDYIEQLDRTILLFINGHYSPFLDEMMWQISHQWLWIPLYLFILIFALKKLKTTPFIYFLIGVGLCFLLADRISVLAFKEVFLRYRPTHNTDIQDLIHTYINSNGDEYRGGLYGFISSHSANFFALTTFLMLCFKSSSKWWKLLYIWPILIGYSRIYLGVHYPLDVIVGAILGIVIGIVVFKGLTTFSALKEIK